MSSALDALTDNLAIDFKLPHRGEPAGLGVEVGHELQAACRQVG